MPLVTTTNPLVRLLKKVRSGHGFGKPFLEIRTDRLPGLQGVATLIETWKATCFVSIESTVNFTEVGAGGAIVVNFVNVTGKGDTKFGCPSRRMLAMPYSVIWNADRRT